VPVISSPEADSGANRASKKGVLFMNDLYKKGRELVSFSRSAGLKKFSEQGKNEKVVLIRASLRKVSPVLRRTG